MHGFLKADSKVDAVAMSISKTMKSLVTPQTGKAGEDVKANE